MLDLSGFLRTFYEKCLSQDYNKSDCIKTLFVEAQQQPISKSRLLKKSNWYSGEENCLIISPHAASFFKIIELEIIPATMDMSSAQEVIEYVLLHRVLLDHWYHLTNQYFSEELSILFLRELVSAYIKFSLQFEEKRLNRLQEKSVRASTVALRTHLQRNYTEKETDDSIE